MKDYSKELISEQKTVKLFTDPLNKRIEKLTLENEALKSLNGMEIHSIRKTGVCKCGK